MYNCLIPAYNSGEHYSEGYSNINRLQKVPVINHDGFLLTERLATYILIKVL